ncbi:polysaccharide deacetylase family protein [Sphingomonas sp.]|uniref:polysaccharide deacetylase family protein n=1 Tax=Sphingomonas sp. TaxID=28214 RepID=UPI002EDB9347
MIRLLLFIVALMFVVRAEPIATVDASAPQEHRKLIALSFDDVPRMRGAFLTPQERGERLIAVLKEKQVDQAAFFLNPGQLTEYGDTKGATQRIKDYVAAGHVLANHSFTHPRLANISAADYLSNIDAAEIWLSRQPGHRPWFRYPFLNEGGKDMAKRDVIRAGLKARGLLNAYVTVDGSDWNMEDQALRAVKAGKKIDMDALRALYVETHVQSADFTDAMMVRTLGRSPAHMLLLHETDMAALFLGDLIDALRKDGWEIISADGAFADPIYRMAPETPYAAGTLAEALAWEKGITGPRWYERNNTRIANALFAERVLHEKVP